jgi:flagellar protein FliJ
MYEPQALATLLKQNERQRDAAIAEHQRVLVAQRAAAEQSEQLRTYRREYEQRWQAQFARSGAMEVVQCYHGFMARLGDAVEHQAAAEAHAFTQVARAFAALQAAELRCASVKKLIGRRVGEIRIAADRREQKQSDERANRAAWAGLGGRGQARLV